MEKIHGFLHLSLGFGHHPLASQYKVSLLVQFVSHFVRWILSFPLLSSFLKESYQSLSPVLDTGCITET